MVNSGVLLDSLAAMCLVENQLQPEPKLIAQVTAIFRKTGKRAFTPALKTQLRGLGIVADPQPVSHEEVVRAANHARELTTLVRCANAFIAGLSIDLAALRAPLRAFAVTAHFPDHKSETLKSCRVCGYSAKLLSGEYCAADNLSTLLSAGIHGRVDEAYAAARTLNWFATLPPIVPTHEQVARFQEVLSIIARSPTRATCNSILKDLSGPLGGDKTNRLFVIETLGYCGVLHTKLGEPLLDRWVSRHTIRDHPQKFNEAESPACFWKREFGFSGTRFRELFPGVTLPPELDGPMS